MKNKLVLFLIVVVCYHSCFADSQFLRKGSSLSVQEKSGVLRSPDGSFTCGFYQVGTNAYCFSIWYTNSANKTVVWMANRDRPVNGRGSKVSLHGDGMMALTDVDGSLVWSTNTSKANVHRGELLDTGNLVLKDPKGNILWQSFDSPTDTLLPWQLFTKRMRLTSVRATTRYSTGYYNFFYNNDNVLRLLYDGPDISSMYWPNPNFGVYRNGRTNYNSTRISVLDDMGRFVGSDRLRINASDMGLGIKRRLTMDYDGNLRLYSLNESSGLWKISWEAMQQQCLVHGLCGRNGICAYKPKPTCSCPPGFEMADQTDWSKGCNPKFKSNCNQEVKFVEVTETDYYGFDIDSIPGISLDDCRNLCLVNCSCVAFNYKMITAQCYTKTALFNGFCTTGFPGNIYIKLPVNVEAPERAVLQGSDPICRPSERQIQKAYSDLYSVRRRTEWAYLYWFVLAIGIIEMFFLTTGWWFLYRRHEPKSVLDGYSAISNQFRKFTYAELNKATKKFKEELGRGGSGIVYKGILEDDREVAVKKLGDVIQGEEEFWSEVSTIGRINHMNLARMWGFCSEKTRKLLVYEYMENGALDKHLFPNVCGGSTSKDGFLEWKQRFKIALGAAKGLAYLHHECLEWVIHCDVKPENILLDLDFEPKIADFGLAKLSNRGGSGSEFSRIRGTKGYMAPEWALNLPITAKVDVFSFGIVLLEIVKGIRLSTWVVKDGENETQLTRFLRETKKKIRCGENSWIDDIMDPGLKAFNRNQAAMVVEVGISCVEEDRLKRPTMDSVLQSLLSVEDERGFRGTSVKKL